MPSKQKDVAKSNISPVLFMSVDGEPMSFFLRPGPVKRELQPLIMAGGGMLCKVQQPGAILLINPEEKGSITEATAHWYVSTKYIHDCIEKDEQLNIEDYRLNPEEAPRQSSRLNISRESSGRVAYTSEDDAAILSYISKRKAEIGGNRLWQEMEKQRVTCHSWQSMKYRYRVQLAKKPSEVTDVETAEGDTEAGERERKADENPETDVKKPSSAEDAAPPPLTQSAESDLTQIDSQPVLDESAKPEIVEGQTSISTNEEVMQHVDPQQDELPPESTQAETVEPETCNPPQLEETFLDTQADFHLFLAESMEPEAEEAQKKVSTHKESVPEDSPAAHIQSPHDTSSKKKQKEKQKASPQPELPQRRLTRRQLQLEESVGPEPYGKKLRSSSSALSSPQPSSKTKPAVTSLQEDATEQPPNKRARGKSAAAAPEIQQEESGPASVCETAQADPESISMPQRGEKKKDEKKLGILEAATKEFEDDSESDGDEAPDLQNQTEEETMQPTSTEPSADPAADAASTESDPEPGPSLQGVMPETRASTSNCLPETVDPQAAAAEPAAAEAVKETCTPHLFIFDSESQEEDSQSLVGDDTVVPANPQPAVNKDAAFSLTQVQLEEDKQRIKELMKQTNQDLASVTKALLKTSGDCAAALDLLLNPGCISGPFWDRHDDTLLLSADPSVRQQLQEKYGEEDLAKRIVFLEVEG